MKKIPRVVRCPECLRHIGVQGLIAHLTSQHEYTPDQAHGAQAASRPRPEPRQWAQQFCAALREIADIDQVAGTRGLGEGVAAVLRDAREIVIQERNELVDALEGDE